MNISYNWLKQYIHHDLTPEEIAQVLTGIGLEVEAIDSLGKKDDLNGFVIGKVTSCQKHPDADHLFITTVDIGKEEELNIVCGAPNVDTNQHVVVATIGSKIQKGDQHFIIKRAKIRGIVSEGMICAEDEIGMGESHDGIMVLPEDVTIGMDAGSYFHPESDFRLTIGLTPNRIDSASHIGVARDLAAFLSQHGVATLSRPDLSSFREGDGSDAVEVTIENEQACRRYAGICLKDVTVAESPAWLQGRLRAVGLNPINNIVDITNFVLYEMGQPLHAFDTDTLKDRKIIVKNLPAGSRFITLDGNEHTLSDEDLMICDGSGPVAIAGVFGGLESGVTAATKNVFLESAYFEPVSVRKTSKRLGINTDASYRFERGIDPDITLDALKRCALMIEEIAGGQISSAIVDEYPNPIKPRQVRISYENVARLIGKTLSPDVIKPILTSLEMQIIDESNEGLMLLVPPYRVDVEREADVIEEILRIYGYNNIDMSDKLNASLSFSRKPEQESVVDSLSDFLCSNGFYEIMNNSLTKSSYYDNLNTFKPEQLVKLLNPLSHDLNVMRQTLILGGLETISHNTNRQRADLKFFEFGKCYRLKEGFATEDPLTKYHEELRLSLFLTGRSNASDWTSKTEPGNFYILKGYLENLLALAGLDPERMETEKITDKKDIYETGLRYRSGKHIIAELGLIAHDMLKRFDLKSDVFHAEAVWDNLMESVKKHEIQYKDLPKYPEARRDLSLLLDKNVTYSQIRDIGFRTEKQILKRIQLFDVFEGKKIEQGKKSYAVAFILQDPEKTLTDERIDRTMKKLMDTYIKELNAVIR